MNIEKFRNFLEINAFGVCAYLSEKLGIKTERIRLFFIYTSFITFGSPVIIYLVLAFLIDLRKLFKKKKRTSIWEL